MKGTKGAVELEDLAGDAASTPDVSASPNVVEELAEVLDCIVNMDPEREIAEAAERRREDLEKASAALQKERKQIRARGVAVPIAVSAFLSVLIAILASICLAVYWNPFRRVGVLSIAIANEDVAVALGPNSTLALGAVVVGALKASGRFNFADVTDFEGRSDLRADLTRMVVEDDVWATLHIPADFTSAWVQSYYRGVQSSSSSSSAEYSNVVELIQDPGKHVSTVSVVKETIQAIVDSVCKGFFAKIHAGQLGPHSPSAPIGAIYNPIQLKSTNIHQVTSGQFIATYLPALFLWVITAVFTPMIRELFVRRMNEKVVLKFHSVMLLRYGTFTAMAILLSGIITGILSEYGMPAAHGYAAIFGVCLISSLSYWGVQFFLTSWLGGMGLMVGLLILYVENVTAGSTAKLETLGSAWNALGNIFPFYHTCQLLRWASFGTVPNEVPTHLGAIFAWAIGGLSLGAIGQYLGVMDPKMKVKKA